MQPLISVIVPIYNVEPYLARCVDSIIAQTYCHTEIILVDDGSTDGCGKICEDYALKHCNIQVVHKVNGGLSSARNAGIDIARGEYFVFVDSDDWILPRHIELLYESVRHPGLKMALCQSIIVHSEDDLQNMNTACGYSILDKENVIEEALSRYKWWSACDKIFHKSLFAALRFPDGRINEDYAIIFYLFHLCKQIAVGDQATYCYFVRPGSITKSGFNEVKLTEYLNCVEVHEFIKINYPSCAIASENILISSCLKLLSAIALSGEEHIEYRQKILATIRHSFLSWIKNPYLKAKQKLLLLPAVLSFSLFKISNSFYRKIWSR